MIKTKTGFPSVLVVKHENRHRLNGMNKQRALHRSLKLSAHYGNIKKETQANRTAKLSVGLSALVKDVDFFCPADRLN